MLGEADFDLSKYANNPDQAFEDKLPLKGCALDPDACIEIYIKAKIIEKTQEKLVNQYKGMQTIEERENEADPREEFERKEKKYKKQLEHLQEELDSLEQKLQLKQHELITGQTRMHNSQRPKEDLLRERDMTIKHMQEEIESTETLCKKATENKYLQSLNQLVSFWLKLEKSLTRIWMR